METGTDAVRGCWVDLRSPIEGVWQFLSELQPCISSDPYPWEVSGFQMAWMGADVGLQCMCGTVTDQRELSVCQQGLPDSCGETLRNGKKEGYQTGPPCSTCA